MEKVINDVLSNLNQFLVSNNPQNKRVFKVGEDNIPEFARKDVEDQLDIFNEIKKNEKLIKSIMIFSEINEKSSGMEKEKIFSIVLSCVINLIYTKNIKIIL